MLAITLSPPGLSLINRPKRLLSPMHQDPQILAVYAKFLTNLVFVAFLHQHGSKEFPGAARQLRQALIDEAGPVLGLEQVERAGFEIDINLLGLFVERRSALLMSAVMLQQHMVANRVDKGPQAVGLPQP